jgi:hypothetical protein
MAITLTMFGAGVLYAEFSIFIGIDNSLISNLLTISDYDDSLGYLEANVL